MIVVELTDDKYGKAMRDIVCIEEKLAEIKNIFEEDAMSGDFRKKHYKEDEERYYEERESKDYPRERLYVRRYM